MMAYDDIDHYRTREKHYGIEHCEYSFIQL